MANLTKKENTLTAYQEPLKGLVNEKGEIVLDNADYLPRIQALQNLQQNSPANYVMLEPVLLSQLPAGASMLPTPIIPKMSDCWHGEDARKMKLKEGHVEPTAAFYIHLANLLGVKLEEVFAGAVNDTGSVQYEVKYNAYLLLPNGEVLAATNEGKASELYTSSGSVQAHVKEAVRKKAKRNAIKALLNLPTSMEQQEFMKPWVVFRPVFRAGYSDAVNEICKLQAESTKAAVSNLYLPSTKTIDVQAEKPTISDEKFNEFIDKAAIAESPEQLRALGKTLVSQFNLTGEQKATFQQVAGARKEQLLGQAQQPEQEPKY